ncbi:MAG: ATP-binding protein [Endomicrobiia bacterium]
MTNNEELEKLVEQEKLRIEKIRQKIKNLTDEIQQKKSNVSAQLLNIENQTFTNNISPSMFSEIQNMLLETITKGYETIIQEKEKIIQKLQNEINNLFNKYEELKTTQNQQISRVSNLSLERDKSVVEMLKKIAELEIENKSLKEKINFLTSEEQKQPKILKDNIECILSHINLLREVMAEILRYFRNPIGMINEAFELIKEDIDGHPANKKIVTVQKEFLRIRDAILTTIEKLKISSVNIQKVDIKSVVSSLIKKFYSDFLSKNITIDQSQIKDNFFISADIQILSDAIEEIILNSIEAFLEPNPNNRIVIKISQQQAKVVLTIEDNGVGIPEHLIPKVFNLFFTTKVETGQHFGIGLFKAFWFLKMFNAKIIINSVFNQGTSVNIEFLPQ